MRANVGESSTRIEDNRAASWRRVEQGEGDDRASDEDDRRTETKRGGGGEAAVVEGDADVLAVSDDEGRSEEW